jgi:hypothetical protein
MPFRPQTEKLKALHLQMHDCGRLCSDRPGAVCKRCGPDPETIATKTCKRGHVRPAAQPRCYECRRKPSELTDEQRAANKEAAELRAARRAGLGLYQ